MTVDRTEAIESREEFAAALTRLRLAAGKTIREVAADADQPFSTVGGYFSGRHLPPAAPETVLPAVLRACGVRDAADIDQWRSRAAELRRTGRKPAETECPFKGLAPFERDDARWYFGRTAEAAKLADAVQDKATTGGSLIVIGASGSGKSSLLRAGLASTLGPDWEVVVTRPGADDVQDPGHRPMLLVVDQLEELFAESRPASWRDQYLGEVQQAADSGAVVAFGLRADFFDRALALPPLRTVLTADQHLVEPMDRDGIADAVTGPSRRAGVSVEPQLVDLLLRDLAPAGNRTGGVAHDPGALPLLSHALLRTWGHRSTRELTVSDYVAVGGIEGAVAATAEEVFLSLAPHQQDLTRQMFLDLVHIGDGVADTRRRVATDELGRGVDEQDLALVLDLFVESRLITADRHVVTITHEALIAAWPRLHAWIDADREVLLAQRRLATAAADWERSGQDPATALRGAPLARAVDLLGSPRAALNTASVSYVRFSRELADAEEVNQRRRIRRLRLLTAVLAVLVLVAAGLGAAAAVGRADATAQRDVALSRLLALKSTTVAPSDSALGAQLALAAYRTAPTVEAVSAVLETTRLPATTRLLGSQGVVQAVVAAHDGTVIAAAGTDGRLRLWLRDAGGRYASVGQVPAASMGELYALAYDPRSEVLYVAGLQGRIHRFDIRDAQHPSELPVLPRSGASIHGLDISPDGHLLAVGSTDSHVELYTPDGELIASYPTPTGVEAVRFSPDGRRLASSGARGVVQLWTPPTVAPGIPSATLVSPATRTFHTLTFSPDGSSVAAGNSDQGVYVWSTQTLQLRQTLRAGASWINAAAFSPDGRLIAAANSDNDVRLWDIGSGSIRATLPHPAPVTSVRFADDGTSLVTGAGDGAVRVWHLPSPAVQLPGDGVFSVTSRAGRLLAGTSAADATTSLMEITGQGALRPLTQFSRTVPGSLLSGASALSTDGTTAVIGRADGMVELWDLTDPHSPRIVGDPARPTGADTEYVALDGNGAIAAAAGDDQEIRLFDLRRERSLAVPTATLRGPTAAVNGIAFDRTGTLLAAASADRSAYLWNITDVAHPLPLSEIHDHTNYVNSVSFSPVTDMLVTAGADQTVRLWDVADPRIPRPIGPPLTGPAGPVISTAISPDGTTLAAGSADQAIWIWKITDPTRPRLVAAPSLGATVNSLDFLDNTHLAVATLDHTVSVIATDVDEAARRICATAGSPITQREWDDVTADIAYQDPCGR